MKYFVSFCTSDSEVGANFLWHTNLLLSMLVEVDGVERLEVIENLGFYGVPCTRPQDNWLASLQRKLNLDTDLSGNHGVLVPEKIRYFDQGKGLHEATFELTEEQFILLQGNCNKMITEQEQAINEAASYLRLSPKEAKEVKRYKFEHYSRDIYDLEQIRAKLHHSEPRLKPFQLKLSLSLFGPMQSIKNCKSQIVALLATVLTPQQIARLTQGGAHPVIPRLSGPMNDLFLYSEGPLQAYTKPSGVTLYSRDSNTPGVKLVWTLPPQNVDTFSEETRNSFNLDEDYGPAVKTAIRKLQGLEWLLRNANTPESIQRAKESLIEQIVSLYKSFFNVKLKEPCKATGWRKYMGTLFSVPMTEEQDRLQTILYAANDLFNSLYMAVIDGWRFTEFTELEAVDLPAVAAYLPEAEQKNMCQLIGRVYCKPEIDLDDNEACSSALWKSKSWNALFDSERSGLSQADEASLLLGI